jgi:hypothetical protein
MVDEIGRFVSINFVTSLFNHLMPRLRALICFLVLLTAPLIVLSQSNFKMLGRVVDYDTKQPLGAASIIIKQTKTGTVTNDSGYFSFSYNSVSCTIQVTLLGYAKATREINLQEDPDPVLILLKRKANEELDEVIVRSGTARDKTKELEMGVVRLNPEQINKTPLVFGEADIIKALMLQPGITNSGEGGGGYNVRGGNTDQNLTLLDGAPLFSTSHLLGFYTAVSPDAVQDVSLYKGNMPATYGGRLSSLLNMRIKNGSPERMHYTGGVGPMSARFFMDGPLVKNKLTFTAGARVAYPDLMLNQLEGDYGNSRAFFYDGILKAEYSFNPNNRLAITGYRSYDKFRFDTSTAYTWQTDLVSLNYTSDINSKLSLKINANGSWFHSTINGMDKYYEYELKSAIAQQQLKPVVTYILNDKHTIEGGLDLVFYQVSPGSRKRTSDSANIIPVTIEKEKGREMAAFISDRITLNDKLSVELGLRYAGYDYLGPKTVYEYKPGVPLSRETVADSVVYGSGQSIKHYGGFEPRVAVKIGIEDALALKLSYNRAQQFVQLVSNTTSISPVDFWKLSDRYIQSAYGDQYSAGLFKNFPKGYEASVELYYKTSNNVLQYKDGATLLLNPYIESALLNAKGRAYGGEFSFAKIQGKFTWQFNYTYSRSEVQVQAKYPSEIVNGGQYYPSDMDRPHNLSLLGKVKMGRGWTFSSNFVFTSGRPATYPDGNYAYNGGLVNNYSRRNEDRLPAYHRLDIAFSYISKRYAEQRSYSLWNFSFYNIYMHQNAYSIFFKRDDTRLFAYQLSVMGTLIPSVSWNYHF